jgi:hypothetical protein
MKIRIIAGLIAGLAISSTASAAQVFFQDFESVAGNSLSLTTLPGFTVTGSTVDVVAASNPWGITTSSNIVDLDGSPGPATIASSTSYSFNAGDRITLSFLLSGNQRSSGSDDFILGWTLNAATPLTNALGTGYFSFINVASALAPASGSLSITLAGNDPYALSSVSFTAGAAGTLGFSFGTTSFDNVGPLLDNVSLDISAVPSPIVGAGFPGLLMALGGLVVLARRRRMAAA